MPKHLNPMVERARGYELEGNAVQFKPRPDSGQKAIAMAWFALERATRFAFFGILAFVHNDNSLASERLRRELELAAKELESLQTRSAEKWSEAYLAKE